MKVTITMDIDITIMDMVRSTINYIPTLMIEEEIEAEAGAEAGNGIADQINTTQNNHPPLFFLELNGVLGVPFCSELFVS